MRGAIFDLDGCLADTAPDLVGALNDLLRAEGMPEAPFVRARLTAGRGGRALLSLGHAMCGRPIDAARLDALTPRFLAFYQLRLTRESRVFDGAPEALEALAAAGWRLGVCTNKPHALALQFLSKTGLLRHFSCVLGAGDLPLKKPDPRHLLAVIDGVGADPARSILMGDTRTDLETARNAGAPVALCSFGYAEQSMQELAPDLVYDSYAALPAMLNQRIAA